MTRPVALEEYQQKRHFDKTPEPAGGNQTEPGTAPGLLYVIQKHAARRLHYDFRLELDGRLLSWAVPKGPSLDPHDRHLAARVEDHPLEYGSFEGTIPQGEYGGGTVELWDRGTWEPEGEPQQGLEKGDLKFTLHGEKLKGSWVLVRMKPRPGQENKEDWLLIKHRDEYAVDGDGQAILRDEERSVASGRTIDEITAEGQASVLDPWALPGARQVGEMPRFVQPELATLVKAPPEGDVWLHEIKFDGYRALSRIEDGHVEMFSRNDKDWTEHFRLVADELARLPVQTAMLDGEVVVQMPDGATSFQALQDVLGTDRSGRYPRRDRAASDSLPDGVESAPAAGGLNGAGAGPGAGGRLLYYVFDLLYLNGYELLDSPIEARKELLKHLLARQPGGPSASRIQFSEHIVGEGKAFLQQACQLGLEGMVSKRTGTRYRAGVRGSEWQKAKCSQEQEFVIGGFTDPAGARIGFGALLLGMHRDGALLLGMHRDGALRYVGKVGTGFNDRLLQSLGQRLREMEIDKPPFDSALARAPKHPHWVKPQLVAQVAFAEWTREGGLRHPSFKGLREDKSAAEVTEEKPAVPPASTGEPARAAPSAPAQSGPASRGKSGAGSEPVTLTHPERVFWPADGITKRELAEHYERVAPWMLPYVLGRPIAMLRCPEGVEGAQKVAGTLAAVRQAKGPAGACFFHKHPAADFKGPFEVVSIVESEGPQPYLTITEPGSLTALAQMGVLEVHVWGATWPDIERPDMLVFDFDPDSAVEWKTLAGAARLMHDVLEELGLRSFVKTTGGKGLHVVAPITPREEWPVVRDFCKAMADAFVASAPDRYTANMRKAKRTGKIYVDYVRNTRGATSIAPYSTRAKEHATVSVPLHWEELKGRIRPDSFTVKNIAARLSRLKGDPWDGYHEAQLHQTIIPAMKEDVGLAPAPRP